jgi:dihydrofolate reductase
MKTQFFYETDQPDSITQIGAIAIASSAYEKILRKRRKVEESGKPWPYVQPTWVFGAQTLPAIPGADLQLVQGDVRQAHQAMRAAAGGKNIWVVGSDLAGQFHEAGLLDELIVQVGEAALARGKPPILRKFKLPSPVLRSARKTEAGVVELRYHVPRT